MQTHATLPQADRAPLPKTGEELDALITQRINLFHDALVDRGQIRSIPPRRNGLFTKVAPSQPILLHPLGCLHSGFPAMRSLSSCRLDSALEFRCR